MDHATALLTSRRAVLEAGAQALLRRETLSADDLAELLHAPAVEPVTA